MKMSANRRLGRGQRERRGWGIEKKREGVDSGPIEAALHEGPITRYK